MLQALFRSIRSQMPPGIAYDFVVCDGGSTDGTLEWLRPQADVTLIEDGELRGAISAFTRAAFKATGKYVMLLNDDVEVFPGAILPALIHLENTPSCGAVAFKDNRPIDAYYNEKVYKVLSMPAIRRGQQDYVFYAQVGMFRKWLGDTVHWWMGEHDEMAGARTYAGDNCLSAHIWRHGYTVDKIEACMVEDHVIEDGLRQITRESGRSQGDSDAYYNQWKTDTKGPTIPNKPDLTQLDKRAARILYLPIYDPSWQAARDPVVGKRGLRDALQRATNKHGEPCIVYEIDYMSIPERDMRDTLVQACKTFQPDVILMQIQSPRPITEEVLIAMRAASPAAVINWNGDQAIGGLKSGEMVKILRHVDLQTMVSQDVTSYYDAIGIRWAYWQIGYEEPGDDLERKLSDYFTKSGRDNPYADFGNYPVVFLASLYSEARKRIAEVVEAKGGHVFMPSDRFDTLYNFAAGKFIYQHAKVALANNDYPDSYGFVSNRLFQVLAAGGALLLQQPVKGLTKLTGITPGVHYIEYTTLEDLKTKLTYWLDPAHEDERRKIVDRARVFMEQNHSFDVRVRELFDFIKTKLGASKQMVDTIALQYVGKPNGGGGWVGIPSGQHYEFQPGHTLLVLKEDAEHMLRFTDIWKLAEEG